MSLRTMVCAAILACASCSPLPPDGYVGGAPGQVGGNGGQNGGGNGPKQMPDIVVSSSWVNVTNNLAGEATDCGGVTWMWPKPDEDMLLVGVSSRGLYASMNGADNWVHLGEGAGSAKIENRPSSIVFDPDHPQTFWESGIYGNGVFKTTDNGNTFTRLGDADSCDSVTVDLFDPDRKTLLAAGHERVDKLLRSSDGGATWTDFGPTVHNTGYASQPMILSPQIYLLGTYFAPDAGLFRSTDAGATWTKVFDSGVRSRMVIAGGTYYWVGENDRGLIASTDMGATWKARGGSGILAYNGPASGLVALPDGRLVSLSKQKLQISADGGATWRGISAQFPWEPSSFTYSPQRKAFYAWYFVCDQPPTKLPTDIIARLDFDYTKQ